MKPTRINKIKLWWHCLIKGHQTWYIYGGDIECAGCPYGRKGDGLPKDVGTTLPTRPKRNQSNF